MNFNLRRVTYCISCVDSAAIYDSNETIRFDIDMNFKFTFVTLPNIKVDNSDSLIKKD